MSADEVPYDVHSTFTVGWLPTFNFERIKILDIASLTGNTEKQAK